MPDETPAPVPATPAAETPAAPSPSAPAAPKKRAPKPKAAADAAAPAPAAAGAKPESKGPIRAKKAVAPRAAVAPKRVVAPPTLPNATIIDASGLVLGRAASLIAQRLLRGEAIVVVHADKSVVTGDRARVVGFYTEARARGSKRSGPHFPRYPDRIFRRTVRGMLPHLKTRGKIAFDRLEVHIGCPDGLKGSRPEWLGAAAPRPSVRPPITLGEVSRLLGARV